MSKWTGRKGFGIDDVITKDGRSMIVRDIWRGTQLVIVGGVDPETREPVEDFELVAGDRVKLEDPR